MSNSNMDPFDEFEFKPLTDGLGFHKKKNANPVLESKASDLHGAPTDSSQQLKKTYLKDRGLELLDEETNPLLPLSLNRSFEYLGFTLHNCIE